MIAIIPKLIRLRDAPRYLGMDKNKFNASIRPRLIEIQLGARSIAFDRDDLDAVAVDLKVRKGRPKRKKGGLEKWDEEKRQGYAKEAESGILINKLTGEGFISQLEREILRKRNKC